MSVENVIFITGTGRSGTNILKKIVGQHSNVATLPFEYRFTVDPKGILDFYNTFPTIWSPYWADSKIKELESFLTSLSELSLEKVERSNEAKKLDSTGLKISPPPYSGWELEKWIPGYTGFVNQLIESLVEFKYSAVWPGSMEGVRNNEMYFTGILSKTDLANPLSQFLKSCFNSICDHQGKRILVEDNTHSLLFAQDLLDLVPIGKMIHVVRDPRDVIASLLNQRWAPRDLDQAIRWLSEIHKTWQRQRNLLKPEQYIEIRFEDLIQNSRAELNKISAFSGIEVKKEMLDLDLKKHNIGRHKEQFSRSEIEEINSHCLEIFRTYDY